VRKRRRDGEGRTERERDCVVGKWVKTIESRNAAQSDGWLVKGSRQKCLASTYHAGETRNEKAAKTHLSLLGKLLSYIVLPIS